MELKKIVEKKRTPGETKTRLARKSATYLFNPFHFFIQNTQFMFDFTRGHLAKGRFMRSLSGLCNPFLFFFTLMLAGIPLSYFAEMMNNPFARKMSYWTDVNTHAHIPYGTIKSARQRSGLWTDRGMEFPGSRSMYADLATKKLPRTDTLRQPVHHTAGFFNERP